MHGIRIASSACRRSLDALFLFSSAGAHLITLFYFWVQALTRTLWLSGGLAALDALLKVLYIFVFHVPLFLYGCGQHTLDPIHDRTITTHSPTVQHFLKVEALSEPPGQCHHIVVHSYELWG